MVKIKKKPSGPKPAMLRSVFERADPEPGQVVRAMMEGTELLQEVDDRLTRYRRMHLHDLIDTVTGHHRALQAGNVHALDRQTLVRTRLRRHWLSALIRYELTRRAQWLAAFSPLPAVQKAADADVRESIKQIGRVMRMVRESGLFCRFHESVEYPGPNETPPV